MNEKLNNKKTIEDQQKNIKKLGDMYVEQTDQNKKLVKELDKSTATIVERQKIIKDLETKLQGELQASKRKDF